MGLGKQAKILSEAQQRAVLAYLKSSHLAKRNQLIFLLSCDAGLRAKEIASLDWSMVTTSSGELSDRIALTDSASKGRSGGVVFLSTRLSAALRDHADNQGPLVGNVIRSRSGKPMSAQVVTNWFFNLYKKLGYEGCSSHSGRRTAITKWARKISSVGGSLRDVQQLARHSSLAMTQRYVVVSEDACRKVVG